MLFVSPPANAITFSGTPVKDYRAPPLLGADTSDVLATIGYDEAKLGELKQQRIISSSTTSSRDLRASGAVAMP